MQSLSLSQELRVEILQLVETALRHQPGLAMLLINIEASKEKESREDGVHGSHSCIKVIRKMLASYRENLERYAAASFELRCPKQT